MEEIQYWGDVKLVYDYQKKSQMLEDKLVGAMTKIDKFNEEELAFGWETTQYPLRKQIADRLTPFKKLFDACCDFLTKHERWMSSLIGTFEPEEIEDEVTLAYRCAFLSLPPTLLLDVNQ